MRYGQPNTRLVAAREALRSPSGSGLTLSRRELADAVRGYLWQTHQVNDGIDGTYIGHLETGRHRWPGAHRREALRTVLGARTDADLGFYSSPRGPAPRTGQPRSAPGAMLPSTAVGVEELAEAPPWHTPSQPQPTPGFRDPLWWGITTVAASSGLFGPEPPPRVGAGDVDRLNAIMALVRSMCHQYGSGNVVDQISGLADAATRLRQSACSDWLRPQLLAAICLAHFRAGWSAFDALRYADASRHYRQAEVLAVEAGDRPLVAYVRYAIARQFQHRRLDSAAVNMIDAAYLHLSPTPAVDAMLQTCLAASLAAVGQRDEALRALDRAVAAFDDADPAIEPAWMRFFDRSELHAQFGRVYRDLARFNPADADLAVEWSAKAVAGMDPSCVRSTLFNLAGLVSAYFLADAPASAVKVGSGVLQAAPRVTSARLERRLADLRHDAVRYADDTTVAGILRQLSDPVAVRMPSAGVTLTVGAGSSWWPGCEPSAGLRP
jgi:tetratricopeptide (TPR) repeat protein